MTFVARLHEWVRRGTPARSPVTQVPAGSGVDETLELWFRPELLVRWDQEQHLPLSASPWSPSDVDEEGAVDDCLRSPGARGLTGAARTRIDPHPRTSRSA